MKFAFLSNPLRRLGLLLLLAAALFETNAPAQIYFNTNYATTNLYWSASTTWSNANVPAIGGATNDIIYFSAGTGTTTINTTNNLAGAFILNQMTVVGPGSVTVWCSNTSSLLFTNSGSTLPSITNNLAAGNRILTLNTPITLATNLNIMVAGNTVLINSNITELSPGITLAAINYVTNGAILGGNTNWLQLGGSNSYAGGTTNSGNLIQVATNFALGYGPLIMNGGALSNSVNVTLTNIVNLMKPTPCFWWRPTRRWLSPAGLPTRVR